MPITYNGIGTHYYGKRNVQSRPGVCPHCRRSVTLLSYDTRLWFVIFLIPIIPLGRKRIIDSCPACRRHYVAELQKWETARQLEISGALDKYRTNPTPETAIEAHRQLVIFHQLNEAEVFQKEMCEKFPDNARIQIYLALTMSQLGKAREAEPFFKRAFELRPDLPEARAGVAQIYIREKRLDDARALLDFMDKPGAAQLYSLAPLERLAIAYQEAGRHLQALPLFGRLLDEIPTLAQNRTFRKVVQRSESGDRPSILPKAKFNLFKFLQQADASLAGNGQRAVSNRTLLITVGCALVLAIAGLMISNEYVRRHRTLYVVNSPTQHLKLEISGIGPMQIATALTEVSLPEGHYVAKISGAIQEEVQFDIRASFFERWWNKPAWILNPGGRTLLTYERAVYSRNPQPVSYHYVFGQTFQSIGDVTHPFMTLPDSVTLSSGSTEKILTALQIFRAKAINAYDGLVESHRQSEALDLAEWHLRMNRSDKEMLHAYMSGAAKTNDIPRIHDFLRSGLTNRHTPIEWHRAYQEVSSFGSDQSQQIFEEYAQLLKADPTNSDLMYLCGRVCEDRAQSHDFFARAQQAAPANPYPIYAIAYDHAVRGSWQEAKPSLDRVVELLPEDRDFHQLWRITCMALGQYEQAEKEFRDLIRKEPTDWQSVESLCNILAAQGKRAEADTAIADLLRAVRARSPGDVNEIRTEVQTHLLYAVGDFAELEKTARREKSPSSKFALFEALVEQNRLDEATKIYGVKDVQNPEILLAVSLAWRLNDKLTEAEQWKAAFLQSLREQGGRNARLAARLTEKTDPTPADLEESVLSVPFRATLLTEVAMTHPKLRDALTKTARQINVDRAFPYYLVQRAIVAIP
ncbi:MAG: cellulose synthase subunit BcsC [Pedosphaera sp.]|nr:cellulose synthase subunit BcsC [Pedosphaera sp.]